MFADISTLLLAGDIGTAKSRAHQAHALLEVLAAMDMQDLHPGLSSPKCEERRQATSAWSRLLRPDARTKAALRNHFEERRFSHIRLAPLPPLPSPKPRKTYKGGIFETVFLPDDPILAKQLGLPESYVFKHGVTIYGFKFSLDSAIERKHPPSKQRDVRVESRLERFDSLRYDFNTLRVTREPVRWDEKAQSVRYSIHSTTHTETAEELLAERSGKSKSVASKVR